MWEWEGEGSAAFREERETTDASFLIITSLFFDSRDDFDRGEIALSTLYTFIARVNY